MKKILFLITPIFLFSFILYAQEIHQLREWGNNKNIDYLELGSRYIFNNLRSYSIKTVYTDLQEPGVEGGFSVSISSYIMNCDDKKYKLNKIYYFNGENLVKFSRFNDQYYRNDPGFGWKDIKTDKNQLKVSDIICK